MDKLYHFGEDRRTWQAKGCFKIKWQCNIKRGHFRNSGQIMGLVWVQEKVNIREQSDDQDYKNLELNGGYLVIKDQNAKNFNMRGQFGHYYPKLWTNLDKNFRSWGYFRENSDIFWGYFGQLLLSVCGSNYQQGHFWKADIYWGCWDRELLLLFKGFFRYFWQIWDQFCTGFCSRLLTVIRYVYELRSHLKKCLEWFWC